MTQRSLTGLLLIVGPVVGLLFWLIGPAGILGGNGLDGNSTNADIVGVLVANSDWSGYSLLFGTIGLLLWLGGFSGLKSAMSEGEGSAYSGLGYLFILVAMAGLAASSGIQAGVTLEAAQAGVAGAFYGASDALGQYSITILSLGVGLMGIGMLIQKNVSQILAGIPVVLSIVIVAMVLTDQDPSVVGAGYGLVTLWSIWLGVTLARSK